MKKIILLGALLICIHSTQAQIFKKIKEKVNNKVDKKVDDVMNGKKDKKGEEDAEGNTASTSTSNQSATLKTYSKYDFVPGDKIIVFEDFMQDAVGDFPDKWNTNSSGETVTVEGKPGHWFAMTKAGFFMPDFIDSLPEIFTLEYDLLIDQPANSWGISAAIAELEDRSKPENWRSSNNSFAFNVLPGADARGSCSYDRRKNDVGEAATSTEISYFSDITKPVHIAIWRQKERLRLYLNQDKIFDIPKAFIPEAKLNALVFFIQNIGKWHFLITNLRLAVGAPDTRKKILEQNKWVTHGILFDINSDKIKAESYGTLKEMASVMKEYAELKVKIVGHTDADGDDASNLDLSKRRAASVKDALAKEFGIDGGRMETDGKGESEPIDKNDTSAGKANNRRVEFIKI